MRLPQPLDSPHLLSFTERARDYLVWPEKWSIYFGFILITKAAIFLKKKKDPQTERRKIDADIFIHQRCATNRRNLLHRNIQ